MHAARDMLHLASLAARSPLVVRRRRGGLSEEVKHVANSGVSNGARARPPFGGFKNAYQKRREPNNVMRVFSSRCRAPRAAAHAAAQEIASIAATANAAIRAAAPYLLHTQGGEPEPPLPAGYESPGIYKMRLPGEGVALAYSAIQSGYSFANGS